MPIYPVKCINIECSHVEEVFATMRERDELVCSKCGSRVETAFEVMRLGDGDRRFSGMEQYSKMEGWPKGQAKEAAKLMGEYGHCIDQNTGRVKFSSRSEQRGYVRKLEALEEASGIQQYDDPD